ncbi:MAG: DUF1707 domain-containing protein [Solirubrobacteraceae bacterium]
MSEERIPTRPASPGMRASDQDREQLIEELNEHTVAGRLSPEDLEQRLAAAYAARTTGELDALRRDLPASTRQFALDRAARRAHLTRRMVQESGGSLGLFVVCCAIWLIDGAQGQFWPVWVLIVFALSFVRNGWALYGPAPEFDAVESHLDARRDRRLERGRRRSGQR